MVNYIHKEVKNRGAYEKKFDVLSEITQQYRNYSIVKWFYYFLYPDLENNDYF